MSCKLKFSNVRRMAWLMCRQPLRFGQICSKVQTPVVPLHSVIAIGPSSALIASATDIFAASFASV
jgi:hypothetical protein